jgi:hypothetical protein
MVMTRSLSPDASSHDPSRRYRDIDDVAAGRDRDIGADADHALVEGAEVDRGLGDLAVDVRVAGPDPLPPKLPRAGAGAIRIGTVRSRDALPVILVGRLQDAVRTHRCFPPFQDRSRCYRYRRSICRCGTKRCQKLGLLGATIDLHA